MSKMKKFVALLVSAIMVLAVAVPAFADETDTPKTCYIQINETGSGHQYDVYQILTGTVNDTTSELQNLQWGDGVNKTKGSAEDKTAAAAFEHVKDTSAVTVNKKDKTVTIVNKWKDDSQQEQTETLIFYLADTASNTISNTGTTSNPVYKVEGLTQGYYVVIDKTNTDVGGKDDAYSTGIIKVVKDVTMDPKSATPTVDKQVWDETADAEDGHDNGWGETADHAINEVYEYKLIATLPNEDALDDYDHYYLQFTDSMSKGVTYAGNMEVKVGSTVLTPNTDYETTAPDDNTAGPLNFTVTIKDLKKDNANLDLKNLVVTVTYDAYLNKECVIATDDDNQNTVTLKYSNNNEYKGKGYGEDDDDDKEDEETGKTGPDTVYVFTYKVENTKVDGSTGAKLEGAEFRLYSKEACDDTDEIELIYDNSLTAYRPINNNVNPAETGEVMTSASSTGVFNIVGLDAGTYYLKETKAPTGYNDLEDPIEIVIKAEHKEDDTLESATVTFDTNVTKNMDNTIKNYSGATLPETGGMGTTIFYVLGAMMVLAASVLLVSKKRVVR